jgi:hypothetical protein
MSVISGDMNFVDPAGKPAMWHMATCRTGPRPRSLRPSDLTSQSSATPAGAPTPNAEQAWENFWLLDPMPAHMRMVSSGWARLPGLDDLRPGFDTDEVEPLRRAKAAKLEEARAEVAPECGRSSPTPTSPGTATRSRTPRRPRAVDPAGPHPDRLAEGSGQGGTGAAAADPAPAPGQAPVGRAPAAAPRIRRAPLPSPPRCPLRARRRHRRARHDRPVRPTSSPRAGAKVRPPVEVKALPRRPPDRAPAGRHTRRPGARQRARRRGLTSRRGRARRGPDRAGRPVHRAHRGAPAEPEAAQGHEALDAQYEHDTRIGTKALDTAKAVDEDTWASDAQTVAQPYVQAAATPRAKARQRPRRRTTPGIPCSTPPSPRPPSRPCST